MQIELTDDRLLAPAEWTTETKIRALVEHAQTCEHLAGYFAGQGGSADAALKYQEKAARLRTKANALAEEARTSQVEQTADGQIVWQNRIAFDVPALMANTAARNAELTARVDARQREARERIRSKFGG
jgi:hypothetical protein